MSSNASGLQLVPETILKKKHDLDELRAQRASHLLLQNNKTRQVQKKDRSVKIMKPEAILSAARSKRNHTTRWNRVAKKGMQTRAKQGVPIGLDVKLVFCVRIRDAFGMPPQIKKALSKFGLRNVYEGVFLKYNADTKKLLELVQPFVTYGPCGKAIILDLIQRRGHGKVEGKKVPLSDNTVIEQALGQDVCCVDDLVHELYTVGDNFDRVQKFLWPFQLEALRTKYQRDKLQLTDGGEYGSRGQGMDDFIKQIL